MHPEFLEATGEIVPLVAVTDNGPATKSAARWFATRPHLTHVRTRAEPRGSTVSSSAGSSCRKTNTATATTSPAASTSPPSPPTTTPSDPTRRSTGNDPSTPTYKPEHPNRTRRKLSRFLDAGHTDASNPKPHVLAQARRARNLKRHIVPCWRPPPDRPLVEASAITAEQLQSPAEFADELRIDDREPF